MSDIPRLLEDIAGRVKAGEEPTETVRTVLGWFNTQRRGFQINEVIKDSFRRLEISTFPEFESAYLDSALTFLSIAALPEENKLHADSLEQEGQAEVQDPTFRVSRLRAANVEVTSVDPQQTVAEVATIMHLRDFSQIPIITHKRKVHGAVSWQSIGRQLALGTPCQSVMDVCETATVIPATMSLFRAVNEVVEHGYVLVRGDRDSICGIVTTSDLSVVFKSLSEPFLLIAEIENHLRRLLSIKLSPADYSCFRDPSDERRSVGRVADLSLGEIHRAIQRPEVWSRLGLRVERSIFVADLESVCKIRNEVMHFDPDGIVEVQRESLRQFTRALQLIAHHKLAVV